MDQNEKLKLKILEVRDMGWQLQTEELQEANLALSKQLEVLIQLVVDGGLTEDLFTKFFPEDSKKTKDGHSPDEFCKRARRAINEAKTILSTYRFT